MKNTRIAALFCAAMVMGTAGITAYAANAQAPVAQQTENREKDANEGNDAAKQAELAAQAKITEAEAIAAAEAANPGSTFQVKELENENGVIVYKLKGTDSAGNKAKCLINALDGTVTVETEDQERNDAEDTAKQAELASQAKITETEAVAIAQNAVPDWNFIKSELDSEKGAIVYELKGTDSNGQKQKVIVNAMDGSIVQEMAEND